MEFLINYLEKRMNGKMSKSADDTELLIITKLKMSIKDLRESHGQVGQDSLVEHEGGARNGKSRAVCRE